MVAFALTLVNCHHRQHHHHHHNFRPSPAPLFSAPFTRALAKFRRRRESSRQRHGDAGRSKTRTQSRERGLDRLSSRERRGDRDRGHLKSSERARASHGHSSRPSGSAGRSGSRSHSRGLPAEGSGGVRSYGLPRNGTTRYPEERNVGSGQFLPQANGKAPTPPSGYGSYGGSAPMPGRRVHSGSRRQGGSRGR